MIINKYNNGGGGSSSSTTYAESAATSLRTELLEGQAAFPENPNDGDVVAIKEVQPTRGKKSASIETGVYQYSGAEENWNRLGLEGPQGPQGAEGAQGPQGADGQDGINSFLKSQAIVPEGLGIGDVYSFVEEDIQYEEAAGFVNTQTYDKTWEEDSPQAVALGSKGNTTATVTIYLNKNGEAFKEFAFQYTQQEMALADDYDFIIFDDQTYEAKILDGSKTVAFGLFDTTYGMFSFFVMDENYSIYRVSNDASLNIFTTEYNFTATTQTHVYQVVGEGEVVELSTGGGIDSGAVQTQIDESISGLTENLESGDLMVGMAKQLYSPDGVTSEDWYAYRTTAGDEDVTTGDAELRKIEGNAIYPEPNYTDSGALARGGEPVEGFEANFYWGDSIEWTSVTGSQAYSYNSKIGRVLVNGTTHYVPQFKRDYDYYEPEIYVNSDNNLTPVGTGFTEVVYGKEYTYKDRINIKYDGSYIIAEWFYATAYYFNSVTVGGYATSCEVGVGATIPNDIPLGESVYTYSSNAWSPSLPQAVTAMTLNSETYVPEEGDEVTISSYPSASSSAEYMKPTSFVALGLNSFDSTAGGELTTKVDNYFIDENDGVYSIVGDTEEFSLFFVKAVTGLSNGYILYSPNGKLGHKIAIADSNDVNATIDGSTTEELEEGVKYVVYPTAEKPYIAFYTENGEEGDICVHPRWSGKMDDAFEEYKESTIDLSNLVDDCHLVSIGEVRNTIDLQNKKFIERISREAYSQEAVKTFVDGGYVLGTDFDIDEDYIYFVNAEPHEDDIDVEYAYKDNDFGVEYFLDENGIIPQAIFAENFYVTNLVDKLRRMRSDFIHLDDPNTAGEAGKVYEYQGRLMKWVEGSGYTAEWLSPISSIEDGEGTGFIYSVIPNGTKLFEFKQRYNGAWRHVVYSGNTLYLTETGGTVVCAVTVNNTFVFNTQYNSIYNLSGKFENGYIGFKYNGSPISFKNVWSGNAEGGHYELIDKYNHPYLGSASSTDSGIVKFNGLGQIVRKYGNISVKNIYVNTTGTGFSDRTQYYTNGNNYGPDRWFAPTSGGTAGQTLVSAGANAAPVWETRIKVVKITSSAYADLVANGTTDPNTLYAIDDSAV